MQVSGKKYVTMYSDHYHLLTTGVQGSCELNQETDIYHCGLPGCDDKCDDPSASALHSSRL